VYRYGCSKEVKRLSSLSANEADPIDASMEDDTSKSCDDVTFRTWAKSLTGRCR
jgi:hypothetical protein